MVNIVRINGDHWRDVNPFAYHMTKLRNFIKGENRDFFYFGVHFT